MNRNQGKSRQLAETHRANVQKTLQHRLEVARSEGNESLIRQLEEEFNYYK